MQDRAAQLIKVSNLCARYTKLQCTYCVTDFFCPSCRSVNCGDTDQHHGVGSSIKIPSTRYGHRYFYPSHDGFLGKPTICWHVFSLFLRARGGSPCHDRDNLRLAPSENAHKANTTTRERTQASAAPPNRTPASEQATRARSLLVLFLLSPLSPCTYYI